MKKLISLAVAGFFCAMAVAQDTIPSSSNMNNRRSSMDTMPGKKGWNRDSSNMERRNNQWPDTAGRKHKRDTMNNNSSNLDPLGNGVNDSAMANKWPDTARNNNVATDSMAMNNNTNNSVMNNTNKKWADTSVNPNPNMQNAQDISRPNPNAAINKNNGLNDSSALAKKMVDKVIMIDDKMMIIKNGDTSVMADNVKLGSGTYVTKVGNVKYSSGKTVKLKNGQFINLETREEKKTDKTTMTTTQKTKKITTTKKKNTR